MKRGMIVAGVLAAMAGTAGAQSYGYSYSNGCGDSYYGPSYTYSPYHYGTTYTYSSPYYRSYAPARYYPPTHSYYRPAYSYRPATYYRPTYHYAGPSSSRGACAPYSGRGAYGHRR